MTAAITPQVALCGHGGVIDGCDFTTEWTAAPQVKKARWLRAFFLRESICR
jgi:hypothetical protein